MTITCEGFDNPYNEYAVDEYIVEGSCYVEYTLSKYDPQLLEYYY